jgi:hypothetical protein
VFRVSLLLPGRVAKSGTSFRKKRAPNKEPEQVAIPWNATCSIASKGPSRPRDATPEQRTHWRLIGGGQGIDWPDIDEDIAVATLLRPG